MSQPIGRGGRGEGEQQPLATRQYLRAIRHLAVLDADEHLWLAAVRRHAHDAFAALTEDDPVSVPASCPNGASAGQIVTAAPPLTAIFLIALSTGE